MIVGLSTLNLMLSHHCTLTTIIIKIHIYMHVYTSTVITTHTKQLNIRRWAAMADFSTV